MKITTADAKTLAEMLGSTLKTGWNLEVTHHSEAEVPNPADVEFLRMDGNAIRVLDKDGILSSIDLDLVEHIHIF